MANPAEEFLVFCLCAAWCGTCRDYRTVFEALPGRFPQAGFHWIDVEDDADWIGDLDVENFPTLVVQRDEDVLFQGVLMPQPGIVEPLRQPAQASGGGGGVESAGGAAPPRRRGRIGRS
jgi:thiol-disulfide isomerase/thioredoxin